MANAVRQSSGHSAQGWRIARWSAAAGLLLVPLVAMQLTREVAWTASDFAAAAMVLAVTLGTYELIGRGGNAKYRAGLALALLGAFVLVWIDAAVGIIGSEENDANGIFAGVLAIGAVVAAVGRFRAAAMARAMFAMTVAQVVVGVVAVSFGLGAEGPIWPRDVIWVTVVFAAIWGVAAGLFLRAVR